MRGVAERQESLLAQGLTTEERPLVLPRLRAGQVGTETWGAADSLDFGWSVDDVPPRCPGIPPVAGLNRTQPQLAR